jgi:hypothetical protein
MGLRSRWACGRKVRARHELAIVAEDAVGGHNAILARRCGREQDLLDTMATEAAKQRVLVFVVAYNAETTIG